MQLSIRRLGVEHASALIALRREALQTEPFAFAASVADDIGLVMESVLKFLGAADTQAVYGAFNNRDLHGMVGLVKATKLKQRHKAMIWGMYVQPGFRRAGIGRALLDAVIEEARTWSVDQLQLSVAETATVARRLYESTGFRVWGTEPRALHWNGQFITEHHLALALGSSA
jgi:ribosomal protein S18 acetylase RimI-like enzyme